MRRNRLGHVAKIAAASAVLCLNVELSRNVSRVSAQQLPIRRYGVVDGMPNSGVFCIHRDKKGYLWFGTGEGLSRFDGYRFVNYGSHDGLIPPFVNAVAEDNLGRVWAGTNGGGVARLIDDNNEEMARSGHPPAVHSGKFVSFPVGNSADSNRVNALLFDSGNYLWCATDAGLYRAYAGENVVPRFESVVPHDAVTEPMKAFSDSHSRMWFCIVNDLIEVTDAGTVKYGAADEVGRNKIVGVTEDGSGRLLVANTAAVFEFIGEGDPRGRGRWKKAPIAIEPARPVLSMLADSAGTLWIGTINGLIAYKNGKRTLYTTTQGLSHDKIQALEEDIDGNLWIGTAAGVCKIAGDRIVSLTRAQGLPGEDVAAVLVDRTGRVYASCEGSGVAEVRDGAAVPVQGSDSPPFNNTNCRILQDCRGDWWIGTDRGVFRFQGPDLQLRHGKKFTGADGIPETLITSIWEDPSGRIFVVPWEGNLYCYDPARNRPIAFEGIQPAAHGFGLPCFAYASGTLWLALGDLLGTFKNGQFALLQPEEGLPETRPRALFSDSRGWLWIGLRYGGVSMTKDPGDPNPRFLNYSTENGLASNTIWSVAEDNLGRMYFATGRDLDRLDPSTGRVRHFTTADGLAGDQLHQCVKDLQGNIWVATRTGLSRFNPSAEVDNPPPPIYLTRVQVAGEDLPLPERGAVTASSLSVPASRNNVLIEYVAMDFSGERSLQYQHKLEGVDSDWSPAGDQRSVIYARLAPGTYRFVVRAVNQQGLESSEPASIAFRILPPIWQRWWFLAAALTLVAGAIYVIHRYRVGRLIELERVRTRIATDLHDDIGSSLSRMAILSEVVKQRIEPTAADSRELLTEIAESGRRLVDAMSDIVWSIDPRRDDLSSLASRIREFAGGVLDHGAVKWTLQVPPELDELKLGPDQRRQVFLIFKEAVTNAARHAACGSLRMSISLVHGKLVAEIADDGCGFPTGAASNGNGQGLRSMKMRAAHLGGQMDITTTSGRGTSLKLEVPIK